MRGLYVFALCCGLTGSAWAQWLGPVQQPFTDNVQAEDVAPVPVGATEVSASAPASVAANPFVVKGVVVTLSQTTGFARDAALDQAARQALPQVLQELEIPADKAAKAAASVGNPLQFVASYAIVKEALIPTYSLTTDLTFDAKMLRANFGGVVGVTSGSEVVSGSEVSASMVVPPPPLRRYVVRVANSDPVVQDSVFRKLSALRGAKVRYLVMASQGADLEVMAPQDEAGVDAAVEGTGAVVVPALAQPKAEPAAPPPALPAPSGYGDPSVGEMMWPYATATGSPDGAGATTTPWAPAR